ncbi:MAG TPA: hypothetical protein VKD47_05415 [Miltoncostaeaceae bacterium]|nr:hypothetical protein [Miltoncostaeaceae bacterium]
MGAVGTLVRGATVLRPFLMGLRAVEREMELGGEMAVLQGEPEATRHLRELIGVHDEDAFLPPTHGVLVYAAVPSVDPDLAASVLAGRKRDGGRVIAVLVGGTSARARMARAFLSHPPLAESDLVHARALDERALREIAAALGDVAIATASRHPALREAVAAHLINRASRRAAAIAAIMLPGADMPAITLVQVGLIARLAAVHGRPLGGGKRLAEIVAVVVGGLGWRSVARQTVRLVPGAGWAAKGAIGYSGTRAVGEAARVWFAEGGDLADDPLAGLRARVEARRRGKPG